MNIAHTSQQPVLPSMSVFKNPRLLLAAALLTFVSFTQAQSSLIVGQSCDLSGASAPRVKEYAKGVDAYIERVNSQGGLNGRLVKLIRYDDAFNPEKTLENTKRLIEQDGALVLFGMGSAPSTAAILPYAAEKGIPVLGSLSGANSLRKPLPGLFHFRASFGDEINRISAHFSTIGIKRVALLAADLPIGKEGILTMQDAAKTQGLEIVKISRVTNDFKNLDESVTAIATAEPQAVLILAPAGPGIKFVEALKKSKFRGQLAGLSVMSSDSLYKALGEQTLGVIITQIVPFPWSPKLGMTRDYQMLMKENKMPLSVDSMEGYMSARLLVEALKTAGTAPTRASFIEGIKAMNGKDIGGLQVSFSATDNSLIRWVDITMIGKNGKLID
jgi:branched-chain amino acid transport system substrate-binding protein